MPLAAKALIGWFNRDDAVRFLMEQCIHPEPLTDAAAEAIWQPFHDKVYALPERPAQDLKRFTLTNKERDHAAKFLKTVHTFNADVSAIIKVDLMALHIHQMIVLTERSVEYQAQVGTDGGWKKHCLRPKAKPVEDLPSRVELPNTVFVELPHGEFDGEGIQTPNGVDVVVKPKPAWVTVTPHEGRLWLWAGYHRSHARMMDADPAPEAIGERAVPVVLVKNLLGPSNALTLTAEATLRPPVLRDFFDDDLFMMVQLRRRRYEMRVTFLSSDRAEWQLVWHYDE